MGEGGGEVGGVGEGVGEEGGVVKEGVRRVGWGRRG